MRRVTINCLICLRQTKGELSTEKKEKYEEAYNNYQKLLTNTSTFSVSFGYSFYIIEPPHD